MHPWTIACDFDGTISAQDVTDELLVRFAKPGWEVLEAAWRAGRIGSRGCMAGQIGLVDASAQELDGMFDAMPIDPAFTGFVERADTFGIDVLVMSDGLDRAIARILGNHGMGHLPVIANQLQQVGERSWRMLSPHAATSCNSGSGTCKCACIGRIGTSRKTLLIGDGQSDFCIAGRADFVFAKDRLLAHCRDAGIPHRAISGFDEAIALLPDLIAGRLDARLSTPFLSPLPGVHYG